MGDVRIAEGSWFFTGEGADGIREYRMGAANEMTRNQFGYETGYTVEEAHELGLLEVAEKSGNPICNQFKDTA